MTVKIKVNGYNKMAEVSAELFKKGIAFRVHECSGNKWEIEITTYWPMHELLVSL